MNERKTLEIEDNVPQESTLTEITSKISPYTTVKVKRKVLRLIRTFERDIRESNNSIISRVFLEAYKQKKKREGEQ